MEANTTTTTTSTIEVGLLAQEIRSAKAAIISAMRTRKAHPTYGVTKANLRQRYARLEGLLFAYGIVTIGHTSAMIEIMASETATRFFEFSLTDIRSAIEEA